MRINHHLSPATLSSYSAGRLAAALAIVAESHIAWCGECRRIASTAKAGAAGSAAVVSGAALVDGSARPTQTITRSKQKRQPRHAAEAPGPAVPYPVLRLLGGRGLDELGWRRLLPGLAHFELPLQSGRPGRLRLFRLDPGKAVPEHSHRGAEFTMVLRGSYTDELGRFAIGDVAEIDRRLAHRPVADKAEPCVCLVAEEAPPRLRSLLGRLFQPFIDL